MKKCFAFLCAVAALNFAAQHSYPARADEAPVTAATPTAVQITERWRSYFETLQKMPSWTYAARMQLWEKSPENPTAPSHLISDINIKFAKDKNLFRREMKVREDAKAPYQTVIMAYGGQKYQMAVHNPQPTQIGGHPVQDLMNQSAKPFSDDPTLKTSVHFALTMPFLFAGKPIDDVPLANLSKAATWENLQKRITHIMPATWNDRPGFSIKITPEATDTELVHTEVFVDSASGLPLHVVSIGKASGAPKGELKVVQVQEGTPTTPAFPLRIEFGGTGKDKKSGNGLIEVDTKALNFSTTFAPSYFKVPASQVEIIVENDKIVHSRYPLPKEPSSLTTKGTKAAPVKNKTKP